MAASLVACASSSWAWMTTEWLGYVVADGGTQKPADRQAGNTWDDWVWRGRYDGTVQYCSSNSRGCSFTWGQSKSTSYSHTTGWSVGGGFGFDVWRLGPSVSGEFQRSFTWTQSQSENFDMRTDLAAGQWAQPVIVAVRRWQQGHFRGAHFLTATSPCCNYYDWKWDNYGNWTGNVQQWGYKMIQVAWNRNQL